MTPDQQLRDSFVNWWHQSYAMPPGNHTITTHTSYGAWLLSQPGADPSPTELHAQAKKQSVPSTTTSQIGLLQQLTWNVANFARTSNRWLGPEDCTPAASEFLGKVADWLEHQGEDRIAALLREEGMQ
jgi:hypothetical protein